MLKPMLFVGCGGSGLRTLRRLRRDLEYRLAVAGVGSKDFPEAWQFLAVDVPSEENLDDASLREFSYGSYVGLSDTGIGYQFAGGIDDQLINRSHCRDDYVQWRPNPELVDVDPTQGAGQHRAVGRVIGNYSLDSKLRGRLESSVSKLSRSDSLTGLRQIAQCLGISDAQSADISDPSVIIVSSLGGGAGAGIFLDVADTLRLMSGGDNWLQRSVGILYDPSVFYTQDNFHKIGISPNTLAAVSELTAGHWNPWQSFPYMSSLSSHPGAKRGPEYPLIFGIDNGTVNLGNGDSAYEMVAYILSNLTLGADSNSFFYEWLRGNWATWSAVAGSGPAIHDVPRTKGKRPLSSIGFARVSLGRDRFARYAAQRMTRGIVENIVAGPEDDDVKCGRKTPDQAIQERVSRDADPHLIEMFLNQCGLNEASRSNNQVLDALLQKEKIDLSVSGLQEFVLERVNDSKTIVEQFKVAMAQSPLTAVVGGQLMIPGLHASIVEAVGPWVERIQTRVMDTIVRWVAIYGIPITVEVVRQVTEVELAKSFPIELRSEAVSEHNEGKALRTAFISAVDEGASSMKRGVIPESIKDKMRQFIAGQVDAVAQNDVRLIAATLLEDMAANMFIPILRALAEAQEGVLASYGSPEFALLSAELVPESLRPPQNEKLIGDVDEYPKTYVDLMKRSAKSPEAAQVKAFCGEIGDKEVRDTLPEDLRPWASSQPWMPNLSKFIPEASIPSRMQPNFAFDLGKLQQRCAAWLNRDSETGKYVGETLRDYLERGSPEEKKKVAKRFASLLNDAFVAARPFVELNPTWLSSQFDYSVVYNFAVSDIPISKSKNLDTYQTVDLAVANHLAKTEVRESKYNPDYLGDVEIYAVLNPFSPSGALSLADPIVDSYGSMGAAAKPGQESNFWDMRRSRPLLESIPLPRSSQLTLTRGWITARLLGLVKIETKNKKTTCAVGDGSDEYTLLSPPFGDPVHPWDWLGMAMESALLAEMLASKGHEDAFNALRILLRLGSTSGDEEVSLTYSSPNPAITSTAPPGLSVFAADGDTPPADVKKAMDLLVERYTDPAIPVSSVYNSVPFATQLAPLIAEAARQIGDVAHLIGADQTHVAGDIG